MFDDHLPTPFPPAPKYPLLITTDCSKAMLPLLLLCPFINGNRCELNKTENIMKQMKKNVLLSTPMGVDYIVIGLTRKFSH